jgi:quercetin dioxygenase-like cupin family protein
MRLAKLEDFFRGWFIGDFEPSILRTKDFEVGILSHHKGEYWPAHYHKEAIEYNVLLSGDMSIIHHDESVTYLKPGDVFAFEKGEVSAPVFHADCKILVVKVPSVIGDKYNVV